MASKAQIADFVSQITPVAQQVGAQYGIDPAVIITQAAAETGYGTQVAGNNYFGIKGSGQSVATKEQGANGLYSTTQNFRAYPDMASSVADWGQMVSRLYPGVVGASPSDAFDALKAGGYATDNGYVKLLNGTYSNLNDNGLSDALSAYASSPPTPAVSAIDAATGTAGGGLAALPASTAAPQMVTINGHQYQVGLPITDAQGVYSYVPQANGTMLKEPHVSLGANTIAGSAVGKAIENVASQAPAALSGAASAVGSKLSGLFGNLFGGGSSQPTGLAAMPSSTPVPLAPKPSIGIDAGTANLGASGGVPGLNGITPNMNSPIYMPPAMDAYSTPQADGSYSIPSLDNPMGTSSTNRSGGIGTGSDAQSYYNGLNAMPAADLSSLGVAPSVSVPKWTTISKQVQVPSDQPIEQADGGHWVADPSDPNGGEYVLNAPAPKPTYKTIQQRVLNPAYTKQQQGLAAMPVPPPQPRTAADYQALGQTPGQAYNSAAAPALNSLPASIQASSSVMSSPNAGGDPGGAGSSGESQAGQTNDYAQSIVANWANASPAQKQIAINAGLRPPA